MNAGSEVSVTRPSEEEPRDLLESDLTGQKSSQLPVVTSAEAEEQLRII